MPKEVAGFDTTWFKGVSYEVDGRGRSGLLEAYRQISGNFLGPLTVAEGRNAFHIRTLFHCWEQITAAEAARGQRYKYWIFARLDWLWLALPPALSTFQRADPAAVWIPDGQDWDGINDRFAVVPRRYAKPYFGRWPWLVNGSLLPMMLRAATRSRSEVSPDLYRGPEWSLLAALHWYRLPVRRFGSTGAVLCLGGRRAKYGRCTRRKRPSDLSYKYSGEVYNYARCCLDRPAGLFVLPSPAAAEAILTSGQYPFCWNIVEAVQRCLGRCCEPGQLVRTERRGNDLASGPGGDIYVLDKACSRVTLATVTGGTSDGGLVVAGGSQGSFLSNLFFPEALAFDDASGQLYIADTQNHRVLRWIPSGASGTAVVDGGPGTDAGKLNFPSGVTLTSSGWPSRA
ncbi:unnamed protein product [Symbiodinium sp. KB8]|nr:unnamed protein product [Symbiodinium sp. KB8]